MIDDIKDLITWAIMVAGFGTIWGKTQSAISENSKEIKSLKDFKERFVNEDGIPLYVPQTTCREHRNFFRTDIRERFEKIEKDLDKNTTTTEQTHTQVTTLCALIREMQKQGDGNGSKG